MCDVLEVELLRTCFPNAPHKLRAYAAEFWVKGRHPSVDSTQVRIVNECPGHGYAWLLQPEGLQVTGRAVEL